MEYKIVSKKRVSMVFDSWMTKLEMNAFGWRQRGGFTEYSDIYDVEVDWDSKKATATRRFTNYTIFKRIEPYGNSLLKFWEILMNIQSWIRRKLILLLMGMVLIFLFISATYLITKGMDWAREPLIYALSIAAFIYLPSLFYAVMGFLTRFIFRLDRRLENNLAKNGYNRKQDY